MLGTIKKYKGFLGVLNRFSGLISPNKGKQMNRVACRMTFRILGKMTQKIP